MSQQLLHASAGFMVVTVRGGSDGITLGFPQIALAAAPVALIALIPDSNGGLIAVQVHTPTTVHLCFMSCCNSCPEKLSLVPALRG